MIFLIAMIHKGSSVMRRFAWGVSGGSITGLQNFLKDFLTVLHSAKVENTQLPVLLLFLFWLCGALSAFGGLLFLTACMKRYDATYSACMFVVSFVISASIMAAVHYDTFSNLEKTINYVMYPVGLCTLILGALILVREASTDEDDDEVDVDCMVFREFEGEESDESSRGSPCRRGLNFDMKMPLVNTHKEACDRLS
mmetsp:Transcript_18188/g.23128  ORF Transcript_18188/g.23128 Transcript_18188/m.23128 type:complete len:197 (-) Transcript_18188:636-1226(-)